MFFSCFRTILLLLLCLHRFSKAATYNDAKNLYNTLTTGYNVNIRPEADQFRPTVITAEFALVTLQEVNEVEGSVSITGYFTFSWHDHNLQWDPNSYGGITYTELPKDKVWTPVIINGNAAVNLRNIPSEDFLVRVTADGNVSYYPGDSFAFTCNIDSSYFPFDTQKCYMNMVAWGYDFSKIHFTMVSPTINFGLATDNGEWTFPSTRMFAVYYQNGITGFDMEFVIKRRSMFFVTSLVLPVEFLCLLNIFVFVLPQDSGERVGFAVTALLAVVVFLTIAQSILPATVTPNLAYLCVFLLQNVGLSGCILFSVIISSWIYHRADDKPIPRILKKVVSFSILKCCRKKKSDVIDISKKDPSMLSGEDEDETVTWRNVSGWFDIVSFWMYIFWLIEAIIKFIVDSQGAPT